MNITVLYDGMSVALFHSCWADNIYTSHPADDGESWSVPQATELPNNNSSIQVTTLVSGELTLVYNVMSTVGAVEHHVSFYDEIDDGDDSRKEPTAVGRSVLQGAPHAPMTVAIFADGGKSWPWRRNLDEGDGYCTANNSLEKLNREFSYPSTKQSPDGMLHVAHTWWRQVIKYIRISPEWVKGQAS